MKAVSMIVAVLFATVAFAQEPTPAPAAPAAPAAQQKPAKAEKKAKHHKKGHKKDDAAAASETK